MTLVDKSRLKAFVPVPLQGLLKSALGIGFFGNYSSWEEAKKDSTGYDNPDILRKVKEALLKVKNGDAAFERDSVLFDRVEYSWPLLAGLLWIASRNGNRLNLVDFGGSLGSSYFQHRKLLEHLDELRWNVVEQKAFVECGRECFENGHLKFFETLDECVNAVKPGAILLSSVLPYLECPYAFLEKVVAMGFRHIIIDRTSFTLQGGDRLTVQKVPAKIYRASYPAWFFDSARFGAVFQPQYTLIADFEASDRANIPSVYKGFVFEKTDVEPKSGA